MARVVFTQQLRRFIEVPEVQTGAATLRAALEEVFQAHPRLRGYVFDDQQHLRPNVVAFIDGRRIDSRERLDDPLQPDSRVHVMQALSGG
jgi:sulfur-carrier protein